MSGKTSWGFAFQNYYENVVFFFSVLWEILYNVIAVLAGYVFDVKISCDDIPKFCTLYHLCYKIYMCGFCLDIKLNFKVDFSYLYRFSINIL